MKFKIPDNDTILLSQLLKASGLLDDYIEIRQAIRNLHVTVNGQRVHNVRYELKAGDEVVFRKNHVKIISKSDFYKMSSEPEGHVRHGMSQKWVGKTTVKKYDLKEKLNKIAERAHKILIENSLTLSLAESCTGGMVQQILTSFPGSSKYFLGGVVSYSDQAKMNVLGVEEKSLQNYGAVSEDVAKQMATGVQQVFNSIVSCAVTGIAGPDGGSPEKPIGTVHIAVKVQNKEYHKKLLFRGNREEIRLRSAIALLELMLDHIKIN